MSTLAEDVPFDFTFPNLPATPPSFAFDPSLLEIPCPHDHGHSGHSSRSGQNGHSRSVSTVSTESSIYSFGSSPSDSVVSTSTRRTTPCRSPVRTHGPMLLPKIRSQDQDILPSMVPQPEERPSKHARKAHRPTHQRSFTNPEAITYHPGPVLSAVSFPSTLPEYTPPNLLCSPAMFTSTELDPASSTPAFEIRAQRASSCNLDDVTADKFGFSTYHSMPVYVPAAGQLTAHSGSPTPTPQPTPAALPVPAPADLADLADMADLPAPSSYFQPYQQPFECRGSSPIATAAGLTPKPQTMEPVPILQPSALPPTPSTTLLNYLTSSNPAPSLVHSIAFPLRDPHTKHFWWDIRQVRQWTSFNTSTIMSLSNGAASSLLTYPMPEVLLPSPKTWQRHPETETALHSIYANWYLPKLNAALALSSQCPVQLSVPARSGSHPARDTGQMLVATVAGDASSASAIFGGKPSARVVGLVKSFDRFNTGMRVEGNVKRVEYLKGLAHLHHVMREHGCRYGFILTEIELVVVRNGLESTPHFGFVEVMSCQLGTAGSDHIDLTRDDAVAESSVPMTACLALWGLCMLAGDDPLPEGHAVARAEIGAPAEGTRRKALARDAWMPQPQLAEKREAKRSRGWVFPEDPVSRKEVGKRGVRYACGS